MRTTELRQALATTPITATSDPLQEVFAATFGRILPLDGRVGAALLLTLVIEIMSCLGLAALGAIREERRTCGREGLWVLPANVGGDAIETYKDGSLATNKLVPEGAENVPSNSSLMPANLNSLTKCREERNLTGKATLECVHAAREDDEGKGGQGRVFEAGSSFETIVPFVVSHVSVFCRRASCARGRVRRW